MTNAASAICVVGSINIDTTYRVQHLPVPGETILAKHKWVAPGGKGANQAVAAASVGSHSTFMGCVGQDAEARMATTSLLDNGVDVSHVTSAADVPTGTAVLLVDDRGENVIVVNAGANQHVDPTKVASHLSSANYDVVLAQLEINLAAVVSAARAKGRATFVLNPAPTAVSAEELRPVLESTDVLVPNRQELSRLAGRPLPGDTGELDNCVAQLDFDGAVVVTLGNAGVAVYERGPRRPATLIEPVSVQTVDTTGAGDTFCGVFSHFLAVDGDLISAAHRANELAALSTTVSGARVPADLLTAADRPPTSAAQDRSS